MNLDIIGKIYDITGDPENPIVTEIEGWHVNTTEAIDGWEEYRITPNNKRRVFAGAETFYYKFDNEAQFNELLAELEPEL